MLATFFEDASASKSMRISFHGSLPQPGPTNIIIFTQNALPPDNDARKVMVGRAPGPVYSLSEPALHQNRPLTSNGGMSRIFTEATSMSRPLVVSNRSEKYKYIDILHEASLFLRFSMSPRCIDILCCTILVGQQPAPPPQRLK